MNLALLVFASGSYAATVEADSTMVIVSAVESSWKDSGVKLRKGDLVSVKVVGGAWSISKSNYGNYPYTKGSGIDWSYLQGRDPAWRTYTWAMQGARPGALIARCGSNLVEIGAGKSWVSNYDGELFLLCNDAKRGYADNDGTLKVSVTGGTNEKAAALQQQRKQEVEAFQERLKRRQSGQ